MFAFIWSVVAHKLKALMYKYVYIQLYMYIYIHIAQYLIHAGHIFYTYIYCVYAVLYLLHWGIFCRTKRHSECWPSGTAFPPFQSVVLLTRPDISTSPLTIGGTQCRPSNITAIHGIERIQG